MQEAGMSRIRIAVIAGSLVILGMVLFPKNESLVPSMNVVLKYADGSPVANGEVSRKWNHYLGRGWQTSIERTDSAGRVHFPEVTRRVPLVVKSYDAIFEPLFEHQALGFAGDLVGRDATNHLIWQRVDFDDENCCPTEITILRHDDEGEAEEHYFTF